METTNKIMSVAPMKILFVDDEMNVLRSLRRLFMDEEYEITVANSGEEALETLQGNPNIGLIVSDQRMPGLTGVDFLEKAKEIVPDALRILLTGYADINAVADAINRGGAYRYITKPWKDDDLVQVIREAVQHYSLRQENKRLQGIVTEQNEELKNWNDQLQAMVHEQTLEIQNKNTELEKLNEGLKDNFKNSIFAFSSLIELRNKRTGSHSKNVAELSIKIAKEMGLPKNEQEIIMAAALLHDIGKIGIPDVLLLKQENEMTGDEMKVYMQHPVRGQAAVDSVNYLREAGILIRHHHEWVNGNGFPDKLTGDHIPMGAKIIGFADYIDRTIKSHKGDDAIQVSLNKASQHFGDRFDATLVKYHTEIIKEVYTRTVSNAKGNLIETELSIGDIQPGMVLSRDVKSGTGLILLTRGVKLSNKSIQSLTRYYNLDPSKSGIYVLIEAD